MLSPSAGLDFRRVGQWASVHRKYLRTGGNVNEYLHTKSPASRESISLRLELAWEMRCKRLEIGEASSLGKGIPWDLETSAIRKAMKSCLP